MNTVEVGHIKRELPSEWNELTGKQLIMIAGLFKRAIQISDFKVKILFELMRIPYVMFSKISAENIYCLGETINFLTEGVTLTKNLIPKIGRYYGPGDAMLNCTFGEYVKAQVREKSYTRMKDEKYLDELVAVLYRRKKAFWFIRKRFSEKQDPRVRFMDHSIERRARKIRKVPFGMKYAVMLFFMGVEETFPKQFPNVYRKKEDAGPSSGWSDLVISLADGKTDDESLDRVMNSNLYNVMLGLEKKSKEYFDFLEKTKKYD